MSALHQNLLNMFTAAAGAGQTPIYHVSPLLATILSHVAQSGHLPGLGPSSPWDFLALLDNIGIQLNPFNPAKVCVVNTAEWDSLSDEQRLMIFKIFEEVLQEPCVMVGDANYPERNFLGPLQCIEGAGTLAAGENPMYPNFQLADGTNWAEFVIHVRLMHQDPTKAGQALAEVRSAEGSKKKVPRPPNPFIIYRSERHPAVAAANPGMPNKQISKILGQQWQNESDEVRARYKAKADQIKMEFMRINPDYKYTPRKSSEVKRRSKRTASTTEATVDTENNAQAFSDASASSPAPTEE
uniref:MAT1-2-1 n=1 Tax=Cytospora mali TaxID=578113 RepID=A0A2Z2EYZ3_CYTMA|nr:MAT1-2-1 [Valsa mali]